MRNLTIKTAALGAVAGLLLAGSASAQVVTYATGAQGSLAYTSGQALAKVANDAGIVVRTQPIAGYLPLIKPGEIDFGSSSISEASYLYSGTGNHDGRANPDVRLVGTMFPITTGLMVTAETGIETIADLKEKAGDLRIASEYTSSTIIPRYIGGALANGGMKYEDFQMVPVSSFVAGINALGDGLVDVALVSFNSGAGKQAEAKIGALQYVSLNTDDNSVAALREFLPASTVASIKQNDNVPGLDKPANIIRIPWMLLTHVDAPDDLVYGMTKALAENREELSEALGLFRFTKNEAMAPESDVPYHPGALRYFEEAGIKVGM